MNLEKVDEIFERLIAPHIPQIIPLKKPVPSFLDCQLLDIEEQINQGQELLGSGKSLNPEQLRAQLAILNKQKKGFLAQKQRLF